MCCAAFFGVRQLAAALGQIDGSFCRREEKRQQAAALQKAQPSPSPNRYSVNMVSLERS